ncbi:MAG: hypothetical protein ACI9PP_001139 [Halobacteriales archaeon]|jgi:uncharacterized protein YbjT (DUF2867 family)
MEILVTGGTGFVGSHLCNELADRGHAVTALARTPDGESLADEVDTAVGDVTAYDSIEEAFEGQDSIVNLVALSPLFKPKGGDQAHFEVHLGGTENVVRAAEAHGIDRIVQMSALGADPSGPTAYIRAKGQAETVVRESALDWVVVRPSVIFGERGEFVSFTKKLTPPGIAGLPGGGKTKFQPIWIRDLVPILADSVEADAHIGESYEIGGPETLTLKQVAKLVRGRVAVIPIPMAVAGFGLTIAGSIPGFPMGRDQYRSLKFDNTTDDNAVAAFGVDQIELQTLSDYLKEY